MTKTKKNGRKTESIEVRKIVNSVLAKRTEMKYNISSFGTSGIGTAGVVTPVTQTIEQGDQVNQRSGNGIFLHKLDFLYTMTSGIDCAVRFVLFADKRNTGVLPTVALVLDSARPTSPYDIVSTVNHRYTILHDEILPMTVTTGGISSRAGRVQKTFRKRVAFNDNTNITAANGENAIFVLFICDATSNPAVTWDCGLHYTDM